MSTFGKMALALIVLITYFHGSSRSLLGVAAQAEASTAISMQGEGGGGTTH